MRSESDLPDGSPSPAGAPACGQLEVLHAAGGCRILVFPNRSLSRAGLWVACVACLLVLLPAVIMGIVLAAWPVLPFLGLEAGVIAGAFAYLRCHHGDHEEIVVDDQQISLRRVHGRREERAVFPCYWARLVFEPDGRPLRPARLWLRSHGRRVELARDAGADARRALADLLVHDRGFRIDS